MVVYTGTTSPREIVTDPDKGFVGFNAFPDIRRADEFMALEWVLDYYKQIDLFRPILINDFIENAPGAELSLESLIEKGYLVPTGINVLPTKHFVDSALFLYSRKNAPKPHELARREHLRIVRQVQTLIESDPHSQVTCFITTRMYGAHAACRSGEDLGLRLSAIGHWLDRGYYVVDITTIDRSLPIDEQIPERIEWVFPKKPK